MPTSCRCLDRSSLAPSCAFTQSHFDAAGKAHAGPQAGRLDQGVAKMLEITVVFVSVTICLSQEMNARLVARMDHDGNGEIHAHEFAKHFSSTLPYDRRSPISTLRWN